jgi:hypothetical protein
LGGFFVSGWSCDTDTALIVGALAGVGVQVRRHLGGFRPGRVNVARPARAVVELFDELNERSLRNKASTPDFHAAQPSAGHQLEHFRSAEALTTLIADTGGLQGPVFVNRDGGWISLANMRRALRAALPTDLAWVTPHSFRRTVATVVRDAHGPAAAQQQLSHAKLATTEAHYLQRQTSGPDVRETLDRYAAGKVATESIN